MDLPNSWAYLIDGFSQILIFIVDKMPFPFADFQQILSVLPTMAYFAIAPLFILVGTFVNLQIFMIVVISTIVLEGARATVGLWRLVLRVIPALG
jgi:hypothetical protein